MKFLPVEVPLSIFQIRNLESSYCEKQKQTIKCLLPTSFRAKATDGLKYVAANFLHHRLNE